MTHPQQTTREVLEQALSAMEFASQYLETDNAAMLHIPAAIKACEAALAHHTPSTTGEALVKLIPTAEELGAAQVEPAPSTAGEREAFTEWWGAQLDDSPTYQSTFAAGYNAALLQSTADHIPDAWKMGGTPKIGCVQHDCAECQARAAMPVGELTNEQDLRDAQEAPFEAWWSSMGQYGRSGGGGYEKTFAWNAWCAAARSHPTTEESLAVAGAQPAPDADDLYWKLHSLSKSMEGSGRIDQHDNPEAYGTLLDAMNALRARSQPVREPLTDWQIDQIYDTYDEYGPTWIHDFARAIEKQHGITKKGE